MPSGTDEYPQLLPERHESDGERHLRRSLACGVVEVSHVEHDEIVTDLAFGPDGERLATASADRTARLWDVATEKEVVREAHDQQVLVQTGQAVIHATMNTVTVCVASPVCGLSGATSAILRVRFVPTVLAVGIGED
jgi:WD40 repeat protein